jgi:hypothetical protein
VEAMTQTKKPRASRSSNSITKVRKLIGIEPMTIASIKRALPELTPPQISMSLCYLLKRKVIKRQYADRTATFGRARVWAYTVQSPSGSCAPLADVTSAPLV